MEWLMIHRILLTGLVGVLVGCTPMGGPYAPSETKFDPRPVQDQIADITLPDFTVSKMTARVMSRRHGQAAWRISVWVENVGGNKGLIVGPPGAVFAMTIRLDMKVCRNRDLGAQEWWEFNCQDGHALSRNTRVPVPLAGETRMAAIETYIPVHLWEIWATAGAWKNDEPVFETDYPSRINNQALLRIVWDRERSSFNPGHRPMWTWPNEEDSLPF